MFASLKKAIRKKTASKKDVPMEKFEPFDWLKWLADNPEEIKPWPMYHPDTWPSQFHHKCDIEWCGFANEPRTKPGNFHCGFLECTGLYTVTPEMAAAVALRKKRLRCHKKIRDVAPTVDGVLIRGSAWSAREARARPRSGSFSSINTTPFPVPFVPNPLHPTATSMRRQRRPTAPSAVRAPTQPPVQEVAEPAPQSMRRNHGAHPRYEKQPSINYHRPMTPVYID